MKTVNDKEFEGERPLYGSKDLVLNNIIIHQGESALKECKNIFVQNCRIEGMYPFWHNTGLKIDNSDFLAESRAPIWYTKDCEIYHTEIKSPKSLRECERIKITDTIFTQTPETLWFCKDIEIEKVDFSQGDYLLFKSQNIDIDDIKMDAKYSFQYCKNVEIRNSILNTKDAFWHSENVTVYNSEIKGEYLGWYSENLRLVNCKISGTQPLCYAKNLILENCEMDPDCDLCFEYSSVKADISTKITSVKNPLSGYIKAAGFGEIIVDENAKPPADCGFGLIDQDKD